MDSAGLCPTEVSCLNWADVVKYSPMGISAFASFIIGSRDYLLLISGPVDMPSEEKV